MPAQFTATNKPTFKIFMKFLVHRLGKILGVKLCTLSELNIHITYNICRLCIKNRLATDVENEP